MTDESVKKGLECISKYSTYTKVGNKILSWKILDNKLNKAIQIAVQHAREEQTKKIFKELLTILNYQYRSKLEEKYLNQKQEEKK